MLRVACNLAHTVSSAASLPAPSACIACVAAVASILHRIVCKIPVAPLPLYLPWLVARRDVSTVVVAKLVTKIKNQGDVDTLLDPSHRRVLQGETQVSVPAVYAFKGADGKSSFNVLDVMSLQMQLTSHLLAKAPESQWCVSHVCESVMLCEIKERAHGHMSEGLQFATRASTSASASAVDLFHRVELGCTCFPRSSRPLDSCVVVSAAAVECQFIAQG